MCDLAQEIHFFIYEGLAFRKDNYRCVFVLTTPLWFPSAQFMHRMVTYTFVGLFGACVHLSRRARRPRPKVRSPNRNLNTDVVRVGYSCFSSPAILILLCQLLGYFALIRTRLSVFLLGPYEFR